MTWGQRAEFWGVCCREELRTAGVHVHLSGQPVELACHPFHVSDGTGPGELTGKVSGVGAWGLVDQGYQRPDPKEIYLNQDC